MRLVSSVYTYGSVTRYFRKRWLMLLYVCGDASAGQSTLIHFNGTEWHRIAS
ncbi:MAG: hypothetical protein IJY95_02895 [Bacteroides sp.]|nr:hypothetical protein [Bacteroides sp.]